ncbi:MAG: biopolymer transporter ExbD [Gemmatimonadetes bacterium]|nr:biopolymer transporter ExbD [Gemmatimonadota bacterium]NNL31001.1 biopolymer transporter ExbD [Gemmatimonadota bacterium]
MSIKGGGFEKSSKASSEVPSSSLADIAFLLLIFFMVTTVFQQDRDRPIEWPEAEAAEKIDEKQKNILNIWMERDGSIFINDQPVPMVDVSQIVAPLYADSERALVISIRGDRDVPYRFMDQVQQELVAAGVVRVVFAAQMEQAMQRERR